MVGSAKRNTKSVRSRGWLLLFVCPFALSCATGNTPKPEPEQATSQEPASERATSQEPASEQAASQEPASEQAASREPASEQPPAEEAVKPEPEAEPQGRAKLPTPREVSEIPGETSAQWELVNDSLLRLRVVVRGDPGQTFDVPPEDSHVIRLHPGPVTVIINAYSSSIVPFEGRFHCEAGKLYRTKFGVRPLEPPPADSKD